MCSCPAHLRLVDCVCECEHTNDRLSQLSERRRELEAEVDRLRAALTALGRNERAAANRSLELQEENEQLAAKLEQRTTQWGVLCNLREQDAQEYLELKARMDQLRSEATGTALGHLAKIERLQSERDALVRKLGLDWGPDEFGDLSQVHVQSIEITNCPDEYCPGWKDSGICPNDFRHRY